MTFYSVLAVTPTAEDWIPAYTASAGEIVSRHGGKYIARTPNHQQLEGADAPAALRIIIEWPSKEAALAFMSDPEYQPLLESRTTGSTSQHFLIEGADALS